MFRKFLIPCLICLLSIIGIGKTSYAVSNSDVFIKSYYSENIKPAKGDVFDITYMATGGEETAVISVDAYDYCNEEGYFELPEGSYSIIKIKYNGKNDTIIEEGYAVNKEFLVQAGSSPFIKINIGKSAAIALYASSAGVVMEDPTGDIWDSQDTRVSGSAPKDGEGKYNEKYNGSSEIISDDEERKEYEGDESEVSTQSSVSSSKVNVIKTTKAPKKVSGKSVKSTLLSYMQKLLFALIFGFVGICIMYGIIKKKSKK